MMTLNRKYGFATAAWMAAIYWLSSQQELGTGNSGPVEQVAANLAHIPLYAGLAFCALKTICAGPEVSWTAMQLTFFGAGLYGVLDEWHQSFVPGRSASAGDVFLDLVGIVGMLVFLRVRAARRIRTLRTASTT